MEVLSAKQQRHSRCTNNGKLKKSLKSACTTRRRRRLILDLDDEEVEEEKVKLLPNESEDASNCRARGGCDIVYRRRRKRGCETDGKGDESAGKHRPLVDKECFENKLAENMDKECFENKVAENMGDRRSSKRSCVASKKFRESEFILCDWIDDEEDVLSLIQTRMDDNDKIEDDVVKANISSKKDGSSQSFASDLSTSSASNCSSSSKIQKKKIQKSVATNEKVNARNSVECHQCLRKDRKVVVPCTKCQDKFYCTRCIKQWYPTLSEVEVSESCPFCRKNCNCNSCLHSTSMLKTTKSDLTDHEKIRHLYYLINELLPHVESINQEQMEEINIEATIQGVKSSSINVKPTTWFADERIYCNHCSTSIFDLHRSCPSCSYELCLNCCREIRNGQFPGASNKEIYQYVDRGLDYMHGGDPLPESLHTETLDRDSGVNIKWAASSNVILCAPAELGGCVSSNLELKCVLPAHWISTLLERAENIKNRFKSIEANFQPTLCVSDPENSFRAASRECSKDNFLYYPNSKDTLDEKSLLQFRRHWAKGEPVIVRNVLEQTTGLSWEPFVMWRALYEHMDGQIHAKMSYFKAVDCLAGYEVEISTRNFSKVFWKGEHMKGFSTI